MSADLPAKVPEPGKRPSQLLLFRNWLSLAGLVIAGSSFFGFLLLFVIDLLAPSANPYMGVLIYLVAPSILLVGCFLAVLGAVIQRRAIVKEAAGAPPPLLRIDLTQPRHRRGMAVFVGASALFLLVTALGSYNSYHFTESVQFCGQTCHTVMKPELTTYQHSPHARVSCTACHIGPGATWFVKSKLSGTYQVYAVLADKYPRPVPTPIKNLRPAQETCEQCHWPRAFVGNVDRTYAHFLADETNTPYSVRMLLKVGGADPSRGPVGGIHWHMNVANKIEYIATDKDRQEIPWVRMTDPQGVVTEYATPGFTNEPGKHVVRMMDCMDCHNRPAHRFGKPDASIDLAMALGRIDAKIPWIKKNAVALLTQTYATEQEALQTIATTLVREYPDDTRIRPVIEVVQQIYRDNFFPEMKASWKDYPDHIGHKEWPGCFRCHDGEHKSADGRQSIKANDCNACHVILAQGSGEELEALTPKGQPFAHPGGDYGELKCNECHTGGSPP
jgi:hypothetical protein